MSGCRHGRILKATRGIERIVIHVWVQIICVRLSELEDEECTAQLSCVVQGSVAQLEEAVGDASGMRDY